MQDLDRSHHNRLKNGRVIIPYGRSVMALIAAHSLAKQGVEIIGCDSMGFTILSFSRYVSGYFTHPAPHEGEQQFIDAFIEKVKELKPTDDRPYVLMPIYRNTDIYARHKAELEAYIQVATPDYETLSALHPKDNFARTLQTLGIAMPKTWLPNNQSELLNITEEAEFPLLIKPYDQTGGRGIHKIKNQQQLQQFWQDNIDKYGQKSVIQELVPGEDYCYTALYQHGVRKASMAYRNLQRFPAESGAGVLRETVADHRFTEVADPLMQHLKWNGVAELDFLWDEQEANTPVLIEVNARFWGGLYQSIESGIDYPWLLYQLTVNDQVEETDEAIIGTRTKVPFVWLLAALSDLSKDDEDYQKLAEQGSTALQQIKDGEVLEGIKSYCQYLADSCNEMLDFADKKDQLKHTLTLAKSAQSEFLNGEDPLTAFGVLFILGSLIRYGKLPPEIQF